MSENTKIGVFVADMATGEGYALITFHPSGMLIYTSIRKGLPWFGLKPLGETIKQHVFKEPLYVKYAAEYGEKPTLPLSILEKEAAYCAEMLTHLDPPLNFDGSTLKAAVIHIPAGSPVDVSRE